MSNASNSRWHLIRESIKFQIKLTLDAVRDLLLSPVAIVCTLLDLINGNSKQQGYFQRLMLLGHKSDHWLNLFGDLAETAQSATANAVDSDNDGAAQASSSPPSSVRASSSQPGGDQSAEKAARVDTSLDNLFEKIENILGERQQSGALTTDNKQKIDHYISLLLARRKSGERLKAELESDNSLGDHLE